MSSKAGKRPSRQATTAEKLEAIQRVQNGESKASVARDINVPESTLRGWCKNQERILQDHRKSLSPEHEITSEPKSKKLKVDDNSNSIQRPFNLSIKLAQADSLTTADNKNEEEICPQNLSTITLDNGRSTVAKEKSKPVGLSLLDQVRPEVLLTQQISDCHNNSQNERSALKIIGRNANSPVSTSAQPSSLLSSAKPSIKHNPMKLSKENMYLSNGWNKILGCQQADIYDARNMNHAKSNFDEIYTASGTNGTSLSSDTTRKLSNEEAAILRQLFMMNLQQEMLYQKLSSGNPNSEPLLYQQLTKPEQLSVAKPVEQPFELPKEQVYAEDLSLHSRGERNSDTSGSPEQCFMSHDASPANSQASLSYSRTPSPTRMFPGTTTCVPVDMSTPLSSFAGCNMPYRENGDHYREADHNNVSKKVVNTSSQSASNGQKSFRKILKPKFEINNLLPENERNKYLNRKNRKDSGFTSEDEDDFGSILAAGEKFLKWLERGKEKSVTHIQVNQVREIVKRLRSKV